MTDSTPPSIPPFIPPYPKPNKKKLTPIKRMIKSWNSSLDALYEKSYSMKMGKVQLGRRACHMANDSSVVEQVLIKDWQAYPKNKIMHKLLEPLLGESIFTTNGELWEKQRRMMNASFEQTRLQRVFPLMDAAVNDMLDRLEQHGDTFAINIEEEMTHVTADIIFRTILDTELNSDAAKQIFDAFKQYQLGVQKAMALIVYNLPIAFTQWQTKKPAKIIRNLIADIIKKRHDEFLANPETADNYHDILSSLMQAKDPETGHVFTYTELVDQICVMFLAGHETSASALSWSLYLAANCPHVQNALVDEANEVLQEDTVTHRHIRKFKRTWQLFREALRLYPPVGFFARSVAKKRVLRKRDINVDDTMMISPWLIHRHSDFWDNPHAFNPERFADSASKDTSSKESSPKDSLSKDSLSKEKAPKTSCPMSGSESPENTAESKKSTQPNKFNYLPFGMGPRICIGMAFASQEAVLILVKLFRKYDITPKPGHTPRPVNRATIRSDNGIHLIFKKR